MSTLLERIVRAKSHLHAARIQRAPSDDKIIADHIDDAERILRGVVEDIRRQPSPGLRAEHVLPADTADDYDSRQRRMGLPARTVPSLREDDNSPEAA